MSTRAKSTMSHSNWNMPISYLMHTAPPQPKPAKSDAASGESRKRKIEQNVPSTRSKKIKLASVPVKRSLRQTDDQAAPSPKRTKLDLAEAVAKPKQSPPSVRSVIVRSSRFSKVKVTQPKRTNLRNSRPRVEIAVNEVKVEPDATNLSCPAVPAVSEVAQPERVNVVSKVAESERANVRNSPSCVEMIADKVNVEPEATNLSCPVPVVSEVTQPERVNVVSEVANKFRALQPLKKKPVKANVLKTLLRRSVYESLFPIEAFGTFLSLVEPGCFHIDEVGEGNEFTARISIEGATFQSTASRKREARALAALQTLEHIFADTIEDMRLEDERQLAQHIHWPQKGKTIEELLTLPTDLMPIFKLEAITATYPPLGPKDLYEYVSDTTSINSSGSSFESQLLDELSNPGMVHVKREIKAQVLERLVQQALSLTDYSSSDNVNAVSAVHALFDRELFHFHDVPDQTWNGQFACQFVIGGKKYEETGTSKKEARCKVAERALLDLFPGIVNEWENQLMA